MKLDILISPSVISLFEGVKVGQAALDRAIASADKILQMGFEVEFVPGGDSAYGSTIDVSNLSYHELEEYFYIGDSDAEALWQYLSDHEDEFIDRAALEEEKLEDHLRQNKNWYKDWIEENGYEDDPEDEWPDEDDVRDEIKNEIEDDIHEFVDEHLQEISYDDIAEHWFDEDAQDYISTLGLELRDEYRYNDYGDIVSSSNDVETVANDIELEFGEPAEGIHEYHGTDKDMGTWYVEPDSSVPDGLEISSPVKPVSESLHDLEKIFDWLDHNSHSTTEETGLHVSLSFIDEDMDPESMDWVKLAVMMGEEHALESFKRLGNTYTNSQMGKIRDLVMKGDVEGFSNWEGYQKIKKSLGGVISGRESSFNKSEFEDTGRIEFRIMGNTDYHQDFKKVKNGVARYVMFLEIAQDPELHKKQYMTKLGKLLTGKQQDPLKASEEHLKKFKDEGNIKKWIRAFGSAFGHLSDEAVEGIKNTVSSAFISKQHEGDPQSKRRVGRSFFDLMSYTLASPALKMFNQEIEALVTESTSFIDYLIEKKTSKLDRMKMVVRKFAKEMGVDHEEFGHRFGHYPNDYVGKMNPALGEISSTALVAMLTYPETDETMAEILEKTKKHKKLFNKIKGETTRKLFIEIMGYLSAPGMVNEYTITGGLRNIVYFMQNEKAKNDPDIKAAIKDMIQNAENRKFQPMKEIITNTANLPHQQEAIAYAHSIMSRHLPKELQPKSQEVKAYDKKQKERQSTYATRSQGVNQRMYQAGIQRGERQRLRREEEARRQEQENMATQQGGTHETV